MQKFKHLFGPIASRRLGISLGVDLVPYKTCSLDCIYCECGKTTHLTNQRAIFAPTQTVTTELQTYLSQSPQLDVVTFSGAGEPTLASNIGEVIAFLKTNFPSYQVAVITNGTLLNDLMLQDALLHADIVIPSLDSATPDGFQKINLPCRTISIENVIDGIISFRKRYAGRLLLEIFIIPGINDTNEELLILKKTAERINPNEIQLNALDRPGTQKNIPIPSFEKLNEIATFFSPLNVKIVSKTKPNLINKLTSFTQEDILRLLSTPVSFEALLIQTGLHSNDLRPILLQLTNQNLIYETKDGFLKTN